MNVIDAIESRMSCRALSDDPVSWDTIRAILDVARRAPSGGNLQPWRVSVLGGEKLREFKALIKAKLPAFPRGVGSKYLVYPTDLWDPYRSRRSKCGEDLYATINIPREDKRGRLTQL
jgi:nitroreductase